MHRKEDEIILSNAYKTQNSKFRLKNASTIPVLFIVQVLYQERLEISGA